MLAYLTARLKEPTSGAIMIYFAAVAAMVILGWFHGAGWNLDALLVAFGGALVAVLTPEATQIVQQVELDIDDFAAHVTKTFAALTPAPVVAPVETPNAS
jgi:acyl-CoA synthetase (AMP-forming)/AMP-acid ligase II